MTLRNVAQAPKEIDGWTVELGPSFVEMRHTSGRYLKVEGESWLAADTLVHRGLQIAAANDVDLAKSAADKEIATEVLDQRRAMAEALVMRDRAETAKRRREG